MALQSVAQQFLKTAAEYLGLAPAGDLDLTFNVGVRLSSLNFDPVRGRRTFYGSVRIGKRTFWLQRWDTARCSDLNRFAFSRDHRMCWTAGVRSAA